MNGYMDLRLDRTVAWLIAVLSRRSDRIMYVCMYLRVSLTKC